MIIHRASRELNEVALIFDDGPNPEVTPALLDVLKDKKVPGNFFLIGARAEEFPEVAQRIAREGHEIGNHTYTHPRLTQLLRQSGAVAVKEEIERGASAIKGAAKLGGSDITFLRPPYLDWNKGVEEIASSLYRSRIILSRLAIEDYDWGVKCRWERDDTAGITEQSERIVNAWNNANNGTLLCFHDSSQHNLPGQESCEMWMYRALPTLEAIPQIIDDLIRRDLFIKTLSEMTLLPETS